MPRPVFSNGWKIAMDVISALRHSRMSFRRWYAVLICVLCNVIDGLDLLLASYALPHLPADFITGGEKGTLISLGFAGMAVGSFLLAPLADRVGRKNLIVAALFVSTVALAGTALAPGIEWMLIARFITGLAVGTVTPLLFVLADEFASEKRRSLCVGLVALGYPIGSTLGGLIGLLIITSFDGAWQALFVWGALVSLVVWVIALISLPESMAFLVARDTPSAQRQIAKIAARMGLTDVDPAAEPPRTEPVASSNETASKVGVLSAGLRSRTWLLWIGYSCGATAYYFVNGWTPQLITTASGSADTGTLVGTLISFGSLIGAALFTIAMLRVSPTKVGWIAGLVAAAAQVTFALTLPHGIAIGASVILGMSLQTLQSSYVASCTRLYPTVIRARAEGLMMGFSRVGTILVPLLVGFVLTVVTARTMYLTASVIVLVAASLVFVLWTTTKQHFEGHNDASRTAPRINEQTVRRVAVTE